MRYSPYRQKHLWNVDLNRLLTVVPDPVFLPRTSAPNDYCSSPFAFAALHYPLNHDQYTDSAHRHFHFQPNTVENCPHPPPTICNSRVPTARVLWLDAIAVNVSDLAAFDVCRRARKISTCKCICYLNKYFHRQTRSCVCACLASWRGKKQRDRASRQNRERERGRERKKESWKEKKEKKKKKKQCPTHYYWKTIHWQHYEVRWWCAIKCVFNSSTNRSYFVSYRFQPVIWILCLNWCDWSAKRFFFCWCENRWVTMFQFLSNFGFAFFVFVLSLAAAEPMVTSIDLFCDHFYQHSVALLFSLAAYDVSSIVPIAPIPPLSWCDLRENLDYPINMRSRVLVINLKHIHKFEKHILLNWNQIAYKLIEFEFRLWLEIFNLTIESQ